MKKDRIVKILKEINKEIKKKYNGEVKAIFGSYARGDENEESDLDVLVNFEKSADLFDFVGLTIFIEDKIHCRIDIVPQNSLRDEIKPYIEKEAIYI